MEVVGLTDCTFEYITIERRGMDGFRWYSHATWGAHLRLTCRRFLDHDTLIYLPDADDTNRHPDAFQGAVNWSAANGAMEPSKDVTIEYNYIECLEDSNVTGHGFFCGNAACRDPSAPGLAGGGDSLAVRATRT